jgi:hypothetical protein
MCVSWKVVKWKLEKFCNICILYKLVFDQGFYIVDKSLVWYVYFMIAFLGKEINNWVCDFPLSFAGH